MAGRPNMGLKVVKVGLAPDLIEAIDAAVGERGRSEFIRDAVRAALGVVPVVGKLSAADLARAVAEGPGKTDDDAVSFHRMRASVDPDWGARDTATHLGIGLEDITARLSAAGVDPRLVLEARAKPVPAVRVASTGAPAVLAPKVRPAAKGPVSSPRWAVQCDAMVAALAGHPRNVRDAARMLGWVEGLTEKVAAVLVDEGRAVFRHGGVIEVVETE